MAIGEEYCDAWKKTFTAPRPHANDDTPLTPIRDLSARVILACDAYEKGQVCDVEFITFLLTESEQLRRLSGQIYTRHMEKMNEVK